MHISSVRVTSYVSFVYDVLITVTKDLNCPRWDDLVPTSDLMFTSSVHVVFFFSWLPIEKALVTKAVSRAQISSPVYLFL